MSSCWWNHSVFLKMRTLHLLAGELEKPNLPSILAPTLLKLTYLLILGRTCTILVMSSLSYALEVQTTSECTVAELNSQLLFANVCARPISRRLRLPLPLLSHLWNPHPGYHPSSSLKHHQRMKRGISLTDYNCPCLLLCKMIISFSRYGEWKVFMSV